MLTYFFDITMDGVSSVDFVGYRFPSDVDARVEALKIASDLVFDEQHDPLMHRSLQMRIIDSLGRAVGFYSIKYDPSVRQ